MRQEVNRNFFIFKICLAVLYINYTKIVRVKKIILENFYFFMEEIIFFGLTHSSNWLAVR